MTENSLGRRESGFSNLQFVEHQSRQQFMNSDNITSRNNMYEHAYLTTSSHELRKGSSIYSRSHDNLRSSPDILHNNHIRNHVGYDGVMANSHDPQPYVQRSNYSNTPGIHLTEQYYPHPRNSPQPPQPHNSSGPRDFYSVPDARFQGDRLNYPRNSSVPDIGVAQAFSGRNYLQNKSLHTSEEYNRSLSDSTRVYRDSEYNRNSSMQTIGFGDQFNPQSFYGARNSNPNMQKVNSSFSN